MKRLSTYLLIIFTCSFCDVSQNNVAAKHNIADVFLKATTNLPASIKGPDSFPSAEVYISHIVFTKCLIPCLDLNTP